MKPRLTALEAAVISILNSHEKISVVQVGANDGKSNDPLYDILLSQPTKTKILLVEPQPEVSIFLRRNYEDHPDVHYFQGAISNRTSQQTLFRVKPSLWGKIGGRGAGKPGYHQHSKFASLREDHVRKHLAGYRYIDTGERIPPEKGIEKIDVAVETLSGLLAKFPGFESLHVLLVDAEGEDDTIVSEAIDLDPKPAIINMEIRHLADPRLDEVNRRLENSGYVTSVEGGDLLALRIPPE